MDKWICPWKPAWWGRLCHQCYAREPKEGVFWEVWQFRGPVVGRTYSVLIPVVISSHAFNSITCWQFWNPHIYARLLSWYPFLPINGFPIYLAEHRHNWATHVSTLQTCFTLSLLRISWWQFKLFSPKMLEPSLFFTFSLTHILANTIGSAFKIGRLMITSITMIRSELPLLLT